MEEMRKEEMKRKRGDFHQLLQNVWSCNMLTILFLSFQVADVTGYNHDEVSVALHDCNFDTEQAINTLLEGRLDQVNILLLLLLLLLYTCTGTLHFARSFLSPVASIEGKELLPSFILGCLLFGFLFNDNLSLSLLKKKKRKRKRKNTKEKILKKIISRKKKKE